MPLGLLPATLETIASQKPQSDCAPPLGFRAAEGVRSAWPLGEGPFGRTPARSRNRAKRNGQKYEAQALRYLAGVCGGRFNPSRWFRYQNEQGLHYCQVDGLLVDDAGVVIFEIKYSFTADAWWQLRRLYEPVVREALKPQRIDLVVVCKSFDPAVAFPEQYERIELSSGWRERLTGIGVVQWKPT